MKRFSYLAVALSMVAGSLFASGQAANAHGYIGGKSSDIVSRGKLVTELTQGDANKGVSMIGGIRNEPQSLEAPKGFPDSGPVDGKLASANCVRGCEIDRQSSDMWPKNEIFTGDLDLSWEYTMKHKTTKWHYYITKDGWNQNVPLGRDSFEHVKTFDHDGSMPMDGVAHTINVADGKEGYHVIYAVWDVADTGNAFYNVIDVNISGSNNGSGGSEASSGVPVDLGSVRFSEGHVHLVWGAPYDFDDFSHYAVYRDSELVGNTKTTVFLDGVLEFGERYVYTVRAVDGEGKESGDSDSFIVAPSDDFERPDVERPDVKHPDVKYPVVAEWDSRKAYIKGDVVSHNGLLYVALQGYQGYGDGNWIYAPSLWSKK